jgi:translation initiation factor 2 beta subunit (eIF-2beta)/eIF-5
MADTEKFNEEIDKLIEYLRRVYEAAGRPVSEFKNLEESVKKQVAAGKNYNDIVNSLIKTSEKYDSFLNRLTNTANRYEKVVTSGTIEYKVLNEQLKRGSVSYKEAFEAIKNTNQTIEKLERQLEALEIEKNLTDPLDKNGLALKESEIASAKAALADLDKAKSALMVTASYKALQSKLIAGLALVPGIIGGAMKKGILDHAAIAADPLTAASNVLTAGISLAGKGVQSLVAMIPVIGTGLSKMAEAASQAVQTAVQFLAQELKVTAESMKTLAAQGASFGGGLTEIRQIALESGMNLQMFTNVMKNSRESILGMGMTGGDAARQISSVSKAMKTQLGPSGKSLRDELLALGYSYEEQGEIQAQYMAQIKATGQDLKNIAPEQLAQGTREYAKNLKVISDITGQDAKKLMEKARLESMRGALMGKLDAKQQQAYKDSYATMMSLGPEMGPKLQTALTQLLAGGPVTDPIIAANKEAMELVQQAAAGVSSGNQNMVQETQRIIGEAAEASRATGETATDTAALFGANSPVVQGLAQMGNALKAYQLDPGAAKRSAQSAENQANATDKATEGFVAATSAAMEFSNKMSEIASKALPNFGTLLEKSAKSMQKIIDLAFGETEKTGTSTNSEAEKFKSLKRSEQAAELRTSRLKSISPGVIKDLLDMDSATRAEEIKKYPGLSDEQRNSILSGQMPQMAKGGITSRPSLAGEAGPEAVVPLPDGKTIPVSMDFSKFIVALNEVRDLIKMQIDLQSNQGNSMLDKMDESINTQRRLLEVTY